MLGWVRLVLFFFFYFVLIHFSILVITLCLTLLNVYCSGGQVVEDVLTSGLSAKLMRYLRVRVLGEPSTSHKESNYLLDNKGSSAATSVRSREDSRGRFRHALETSVVEPPRLTEEGSSDDQVAERDRVRRWADTPDGLEEDNEAHEGELRDGKTKVNDRSKSLREEEHKLTRGLVRPRGKGRVNEAVVENEHVLNSPGSGSRFGGQGRSIKDRSLLKNVESKRMQDIKKSSGRTGADDMILERDDSDDCFQDCKVGSKDISDLVKMAVRAAEAEARSANASVEAIKAAGDAAAELVKTAALEVCMSDYTIFWF